MTAGTASPATALHGLSVLVVEDETIVSLLVESMLADLGCDDVWYASGVAEGLALLDARTPDAAILDVNLSDEPAYPIARRLADAGVPFVFATGYGASGIHEDWAGRPVVQKPFQREALASALVSALGAGSVANISYGGPFRRLGVPPGFAFLPRGCNMAASAIGEAAAMVRTAEPGDVVSFWLSQDEKVWFTADPAFDAEVLSRFAELVERAKSGALDDWADDPEGALALVILLDQMTRNIYRDSPEMFAADGKALEVARRAIERGFDMDLPKEKRRWLYMPFMHSEDLADQEMSVELFARSELSKSLPFAEEHADIIRRFGRFPHRNAILGRETTQEEAAFLAGGGFSGVTADGPDETQH